MLSAVVMTTSPKTGHSYKAEFEIKKDGGVRLINDPWTFELDTKNLSASDSLGDILGWLRQEALELAFKHMKGEWPCEE